MAIFGVYRRGSGVPMRAIDRPGCHLPRANGRDDGPIITPCTRDEMDKISLTGCDSLF
ncbi:E3 SUMO-protein ligase SIZ1 [Artemisia annua]|uniref:E3 SUMO-protein ligase SIZ1 n=1 Tax=Artemisia annua TaxID=35608 RepID=A0A2U1MUN8_ARTAN|nr:E3 SUMO-protein ligase SIZ1 [Artemisia annua]